MLQNIHNDRVLLLNISLEYRVNAVVQFCSEFAKMRYEESHG